MDTDKLTHLPITVRRLLRASQKVVDGWGGSVDDTDAAIRELKETLRAFGLSDLRKTDVKDPRRVEPR